MQAGGRRFDPVRLHHIGVERMWVGHHGRDPDRIPRLARGADASVLVSGFRYFVVFIVSVKRLVRFWTYRDPGWSDPYA